MTDTALENDPNYRTYQRMLAIGALEPYRGQWVAVGSESLLAHDEDRDSLLKKIEGKEEPIYVHRVLNLGEPEPVVHQRRPLRMIKI